MKKPVTIEHCGVFGKGKNLTEAKKDAAGQLEIAMKGSYTPTLIQYRHITVVLFRDPLRGWVHSTIDNLAAMTTDGNTFTKRLRSSVAAGELSYETAHKHALFVLAQLTWQHDEGICLPEFVTDDTAKQELREYFRWQMGYKFLAAQGMADLEIRERLRNNGRDLDLPICITCGKHGENRDTRANHYCDTCFDAVPYLISLLADSMFDISLDSNSQA